METAQGRGQALDLALRALVEASPDFEGALVVSTDGLVMAAFMAEGRGDQSTIGAVATRAYSFSEQTVAGLDRGMLDKIILMGSKGNMIITRAGPHAICVVLLKPDAKVGIASFEATRLSERVAQIIG